LLNAVKTVTGLHETLEKIILACQLSASNNIQKNDRQPSKNIAPTEKPSGSYPTAALLRSTFLRNASATATAFSSGGHKNSSTRNLGLAMAPVKEEVTK